MLDPSGGDAPFMLRLEPGTYSVEWFGIDGRETVQGREATAEGVSDAGFSPPAELSGPAVLYLKNVAGISRPGG